jgi:hypothetical protein
MTALGRTLTFIAVGVCVLALVVIGVNLPDAARAGADRVAVAAAATDVHVATSESHRLAANLAILEELRRSRRRKNVILAKGLRR